MAKPRTKKPAPARPGTPKDAARALAIIEPELEGIGRVLPINVDIPRAVSVAVRAAPHLLALRPRFVEELPKHPVHLLDKLVTYALAAWYAHLLALPAAGQDTLKQIKEEAAKLRETLLVAAEALGHKGVVDAARVATIRSGQGDLDTANDLTMLAALFAEAWDVVKNKTAVEWAEVERASNLGPELLIALGARDQPTMPSPKAADPAERRARAFTLLVKAYDTCRRAATYLRWEEGDADIIAPSLFANRSKSRTGSSKTSDSKPPPTGTTPG
jgi:hypothetical protein